MEAGEPADTRPTEDEPQQATVPGRSAGLITLTALLVLVPLVTGNLSMLGVGPWPLLYDTIALPRLVLAVVLALVAFAWLWVDRLRAAAEPIRWNGALLCVAGLAVLAVISTTTSLDTRLSLLGQSERLEGLVTFALYALLFFLGLQYVRSVRDLRVLAIGLAAAATLSAAYGLVQFAGFDPASYIIENPGFDLHRAFATFGNPNFLAGLLVLALPVVGGLAASAHTRTREAAGWLAVAIVAGALLLTFTRGAWFAAFVQLAAAGLFVWRGRIKLATSARRGLAATVVLVIAGALATIGRGGELDALARITRITGGALGERPLGWQAALDAALARPWLGYGPDTYVMAFRLHRPDAYVNAFGAEGTLGNAHNWPLQVAATLGVPAALLLVAAIVWALVASGRTVSTKSGPVFAGVWLGCLGYAIFMLTNVAIHGASVPFWLLLGALAAPSAHRFKRPAVKFVSAALAALGVVVLAASVAASGALLAADRNHLHARMAYRGDLAGEPLAYADAAVRLNPTSLKYARSRAEVLADRFYTLPPTASAEERRAAFDAADAAFGGLMLRHPSDYAGRAWHAALLASAARTLGATEAQAQAEAGVDGELASRAMETALEASELDIQAAEISALADGAVDSAAVNRTLFVRGLP